MATVSAWNGRHPEAAARRTEPRRRETAVIIGVVLIPFVAVLAALAGRSWTPAGDQALEMLLVDEVGGAHTPLTGAWSRWGFNHPGPLLFYLLAPFTWLFGNLGGLIGVLVINASAACGCVLIARRRGGLALAALVGLVVVLLCTTLRPELLIDPWNPWVGLLPLLCYVLLAWSIAERDVALLPYLVAVGTFIIQAHVGFAPLVAGIGVTGVALSWRRRSRSDSPELTEPARLRRASVVAIVIAAILWGLPVFQQLTGTHGNLDLLWDYAWTSPEPTAGWKIAWNIMGHQVGVPGAWITDTELNSFAVQAPALPAIAVLLAAGILGYLAAGRSHDHATARLAALAIASTIVGLAATARVTGPVYDYLARWWWIISAILWLSIAWSTMMVLASSRTRRVVGCVMVAVSAVLGLGVAWRAASVELPQHENGLVVAALGAQLTERLDSDRRYLLEWADRSAWGGVGIGVMLYLHQEGVDVKVLRDYDDWFDAWHLEGDTASDAKITVIDEDARSSGAQPPHGSVEITRYDVLSDEQRQRADTLWAGVQSALGPASDIAIEAFDWDTGRNLLREAGIDPSVISELAGLRAVGPAYGVYLTTL